MARGRKPNPPKKFEGLELRLYWLVADLMEVGFYYEGKKHSLSFPQLADEFNEYITDKLKIDPIPENIEFNQQLLLRFINGQVPNKEEKKAGLTRVYNFPSPERVKILFKFFSDPETNHCWLNEDEVINYYPYEQAPNRLIEYLYSDTSIICPVSPMQLQGAYIARNLAELEQLLLTIVPGVRSNMFDIELAVYDFYSDLNVLKNRKTEVNKSFFGWGVISPEGFLSIYLQSKDECENRNFMSIGLNIYLLTDEDKVSNVPLMDQPYPIKKIEDDNHERLNKYVMLFQRVIRKT